MTRPILILVAWALLCAGPARAQIVVYEERGENPGDSFGAALVVSADLDGDGVGDVWVGAPRTGFGAANGGSAYALSGASGALLFRVDGSAGGERLGQAVGWLGDIDGDGVGDLLVGAPFHSAGAFFGGGAYALSGANGRTIHFIAGSEAFALFGMAVAGAGDVDGDGIDDFLVGAPGEDSNGSDAGSLYVFSGASGAQLAQHVGDLAGDELGSSACGLGDIDGDGRADFAAGAPRDDNGGNDSGSVRIWSGQSGQILFTVHGNSAGERFGFALAALGDVDGDGAGDLAVGAPFDPGGGADAGSLTVLSCATASVLFEIQGSTQSLLGSCLSSAGDADGDLVPDLLAGAPGANNAEVYSGVAGVSLLTLQAQSGSASFGSSVAGGFDIDGDGHGELVVADKLFAAGGRLLAFSDHNLFGTTYCFGDGSGTPCPCGNGGGGQEGCANSSGVGAHLEGSGTASLAADDLEFAAQGLVPGQPALLISADNRVQSGAGALFGDGLRCAGGALKRLAVQASDPTGAAGFGPSLSPAGAWAPGDTRRFQVWYRDPLASPCGAGFNLSNGFELAFSP
ncbi:MAG: integrin alpha [bacterium]|nr:hypothetical protein [Planctomycetota bacterium]HIL53016.1 hypothetical protein [Planctomycetota bacterium]